jgi:diamine N-acetyltransferase
MDRRIAYRMAGPADARPLGVIGAETFAETFGANYPPEHLEAFLAEKYDPDVMAGELADPDVEVRVAEQAGRMVAFCKLGAMSLPIDPGPEPCVELHRIYVRSEAQGLGLGRELLDWAIERSRQRGAAHLFLGVWAGNARAQAIYARRGFETVGGYKFRVGGTLDDEAILRLRLGPAG